METKSGEVVGQLECIVACDFEKEVISPYAPSDVYRIISATLDVYSKLSLDKQELLLKYYNIKVKDKKGAYEQALEDT